MKVLLAAGADANAKYSSGLTALMDAALHGYTAIVQALLSNSADVHAKDNNGLTALRHAMDKGHSDIVKLIEQAGATQ